MIELTLPYPPSANRYWRSLTIAGQARVVLSKDAKEYRTQVVRIAQLAGVRRPFAGRVRVEVVLYPQRPQDWQKRVSRDPLAWDDTVRCIDLDNARKVAYDALRGVAFTDDDRIFEDSGRRAEPDGDARLVVRVTPLAQSNPQDGLELVGGEIHEPLPF